jgi:glycosyltransferase involved in cell wall biosynthesis
MKLDIGSGTHPKEGYSTIDIIGSPDITHDIEVTPWPIDSGTVEAVNCSHILEHIKPWLFIPVMNEIWRICKVGAEIEIRVPYGLSFKIDPTHCNEIVPETMLYFTPSHHLHTIYKPSPWDIIESVDNGKEEYKFILKKRDAMRINHDIDGNSASLFLEQEKKAYKSVDTILEERFQPSKPITVSICMIVRDEEENLKELLPQLEWADEIVIVDTGVKPIKPLPSLKLVESFKVNHREECKMTNSCLHSWIHDDDKSIYFFPWTDDFSEARNFAKSKCTKDMILWLDADDRLSEDTQRTLREELDKGRPSTKETVHYLEVAMTNNGEPTGAKVNQPRLFPNIPEIKWAGKVHETVGQSILDMKTAITDIQIMHTGYEDQELVKKKNARNLELLLKSTASPQVMMDLGNCYQNMGQLYSFSPHYQEAISHYKNVFAYENIVPDFKAHVQYQIGVTYMMMEDWENGLEWMSKSSKQDALYGKADCLIQLEREKEGLAAYLQYLNLPKDQSFFGSESYKLRNNAFKQLTRILQANYKHEYKIMELKEEPLSYEAR